MKKRSLDVKTIVFSYLIFLAGWIIWSKTNKLISINEYIDWGIGLLVHIIWWPLFAIVLIKRYNDNLTVSLEEMLFTKPNLKLLIPLLAFALVYNIGVYFLDSDGFRLEMKVYDFIVTVLTVGFFEEIVFRGWFQNAISRFTGNRIGNLLASFLFLFIHYPSWISHGYGIIAIITNSIILYGLSLLFGWTFRKNRSIWPGVIFHSFWDLLSFIM